MGRGLLAILICGLLMIPVCMFLTQEPRTAMITMTMDDGSQTQMVAFGILREHGIPATAFIVTGWYGVKPGRLTLEQMHEMQDAGWEIGSHSVSHNRLTKMPLSDVFNETYDSKMWLETHGFTVNSFAYPYGAFNGTVEQLAGSIYSVTRSTGKDYISYSSIPADRRVAGMDIPTDHNDTFRYIDRAVAEKKWIIFDFHDMHSDGRIVDNMQDLHSIANYIEQYVKDGKLKAVTLIEGYDDLVKKQPGFDESSERQLRTPFARTEECWTL